LKVLVIRLSALGDIIHCLPAAALIKRRLPEAELTWLVEPAGAAVLAGNPVVDEVLVVPTREWRGKLSRPGEWRGVAGDIISFAASLRTRRFDAAVDFQGLLKSAVWGAVAGAPRRFGFARTREGAEWLLTDALNVGDYFGSAVHVVDLNVSLVHHLCHRLGLAGPAESGPPPAEFPLPEPGSESVERVERLLAVTGEGGTAGLVAMVPGTTWPSKIWPVACWVELACLLIREKGCTVVLVGGPGEIAANAGIYSAVRTSVAGGAICDTTGKTGLMDLLTLYRRCRLVVGGDTGPLHLAAAAAVPSVGVYGSTPVGRNGPYGPNCHTVSTNLSCQPCFKKNCPLGTTACLTELSGQVVFDRLKGLL
jgi:lipopolysaccharide heptosyltransferase I